MRVSLERVALKASIVFAGCLFLASILNPFFQATTAPPSRSCCERYYSSVDFRFWSFKAALSQNLWRDYCRPLILAADFDEIEERWFDRYWGLTNEYNSISWWRFLEPFGFAISALTIVFLLQIMTLGLATQAFFAVEFEPQYLLGTAISNLATVLGILLFSCQFHGNFEAGFWLAPYSAIFFLMLYPVSWTWKDKLMRPYD